MYNTEYRYFSDNYSGDKGKVYLRNYYTKVISLMFERGYKFGKYVYCFIQFNSSCDKVRKTDNRGWVKGDNTSNAEGSYS